MEKFSRAIFYPLIGKMHAIYRWIAMEIMKPFHFHSFSKLLTVLKNSKYTNTIFAIVPYFGRQFQTIYRIDANDTSLESYEKSATLLSQTFFRNSLQFKSSFKYT